MVRVPPCVKFLLTFSLPKSFLKISKEGGFINKSDFKC